MDTQIREYTDKDVPFIKTSFEALHDFVVSLDPIKRLRKMPGYSDVFFAKLLGTIKTNQGVIFIAEIENKPVGFIAGFVADNQSEENLLEVIPLQLGIISDIYIEPQYRGKKMGGALMKTMEKYFVNKNCDALWVSTNGFNTQALHLYKSEGFMEREMGLLKKIG